MIDIILLIFLTRKIGNIAQQKGLKPGSWKLATVLSWFGCEFVGLIFGFAAFGKDNLPGLFLLALACGFGGYLIVHATLMKRPDSIDTDIDKIGH